MESTAVRLRNLFNQIDAKTEAFARLSGLGCPPGCGACCLSPEVEATELEMEVMAEHLYAEGLAEQVLARIEAADEVASCVLYEPDAVQPKRGRCSHYAQRPTLCRLFAFAAVDNKLGKPRLAVCGIHRETQSERAEAACRAVEAGEWEAPRFAEVARALLDIDPERGALWRPINQALRGALARVMARAH